MPANFVKGDFINELPQGDKRAFACPVDVNGQTEAGVASAVAKHWPGFGAWWVAQRKQLGDVAVFEAENGQDLIFALVLLRGGGRSKLAWLDRAVRSMVAEAEKRGIARVNVPRLWGGASGIEGLRAKRIIDEAVLAAPVDLRVFEQFIRATEPTEATAAADADAPPAPAKKKAAAAPKKKAATKKKAVPAAKKKAAPAAKKKVAAAPKKKAAAKKKAAPAPKKKPAAKKPAAKKAPPKKPAAKKKAASKKR